MRKTVLAAGVANGLRPRIHAEQLSHTRGTDPYFESGSLLKGGAIHANSNPLGATATIPTQCDGCHGPMCNSSNIDRCQPVDGGRELESA